MVAGAPECPPTGELRSAWINFCYKAGLLPTHMRCLNLSSPLSMVKLGTTSGLVVNLASKAATWESCWYPEMISSNHCGVITEKTENQWHYYHIPFYRWCGTTAPITWWIPAAAKLYAIADHWGESMLSDQCRWQTRPTVGKSATDPLLSRWLDILFHMLKGPDSWRPMAC